MRKILIEAVLCYLFLGAVIGTDQITRSLKRILLWSGHLQVKEVISAMKESFDQGLLLTILWPRSINYIESGR